MAAVALILLFLPGLVAALILRVPWLTALAVAPGLSTTTVVLVSVASSAAGVPWGSASLTVGVLTVWLIVAAVGALIRRHASPEVPGRLPIAALVVTAIAAVGVALVLLPVSLTPEAFPQQPDTIFHLGAAQWMVEHHDASFLHALNFMYASPTGFYPAAFHTMVATIAQLSGASVVVSTSSFVLVIAGVAWPLGCVFLARTLFGPALAVTFSAGVTSVAFSAYPFMLMGYGVLWSTLFGEALIPGALALLAVVASAAHRKSPPLTSRLRAIVLLLLTLPALAVAHPNALVTFLLFGYLMVAGVLLGKAWEMRSARPWLAAALVIGLVMTTGLCFLASQIKSTKASGMKGVGAPLPELPRRKAAYDVLLFTRDGEPALALWVLAGLVALGAIIILVRYPGRRWLVSALVVTGILSYANVAINSPTVRLFTWPWNNQSVRLATILVLPATMAATAALATGARFIQCRANLPHWTSAVAVPLLFVVTTGGAYVGIHRRVLHQYFHPTPSQSWVSNEELQALHRLAQHIPANAVVAENPWNGGSYMYVVSGRHMLFPTEKASAPVDRTLLAMKLDDVGNSPKVCSAARREQVKFAITGGRPFASAGKKATLYAGVDAVGSSDAFRKVATDGPYTLYEMIQCAQG